MKVLKLGGLASLSDYTHNIVKKCPTLELFEGNNLERLSDVFMDNIKNHPTLSRLLINFTPNISEPKIQ